MSTNHTPSRARGSSLLTPLRTAPSSGDANQLLQSLAQSNGEMPRLSLAIGAGSISNHPAGSSGSRLRRSSSHGLGGASGSTPPLKAAVRRWFLGLSAAERERVLCIEDRATLGLLKRMYRRKAQDGEGLFFSVDEDRAPLEGGRRVLQPEQEFCFRRLRHLGCLCLYPESLLDADRRLEQAVRMCDTREYLDTIKLDSALTRDGAACLRLMDVVTRGGFLSNECRVAWHPAQREWLWELPRWFSGMGYFSLGTFIAHKLEQAVWMRYWEAHAIDPRALAPRPHHPAAAGAKQSRAPPYQYPTYHKGLMTKDHLVQFWHGTDPAERQRMVGSLGTLVESVLLDKELEPSKEQQRQKKKRDDSLLDYRGRVDLLNGLVELSAQERSLEPLFHRVDSCQQALTFVEILYFSPLARAGTPIDMILRRIGLCIHKAYSDRQGLDLILGEEADKLPDPDAPLGKQAAAAARAATRRPASKKNKKKAAPNAATATTSGSSGGYKAPPPAAHSQPQVHTPECPASAPASRPSSTRRRRSRKVDSTTVTELQPEETAPEPLVPDEVSAVEVPAEGIDPSPSEEPAQGEASQAKHDADASTPELPAETQEPGAETQAPEADAVSAVEELRPTEPDPDPEPQRTARSAAPKPAAPAKKKSKKKKKNATPAPAPAPDPQAAALAAAAAAAAAAEAEQVAAAAAAAERRKVFLARLHDEIHSFSEFARAYATRHLTPKVESMKRRVATLVRVLWPGACVEVFGSVAMHLALPSSDLDLVVIGARSTDAGAPFDVLVRELKQQPWLHLPSFQPLATARVPVIKLVSIEGIQTDITFGDAHSLALYASPLHPLPAHAVPGERAKLTTSAGGGVAERGQHMGFRACELVKSYMRQFDEQLPALVLVLKQLLQEKQLGSTYGGGLSSYCLVLLVVSFLQLHAPACKPNTKAKPLGELLLRFLQLHGHQLDYARTGIDVANAREFDLAPGQRGAASLVLLDPFNPHNNIAHNVFGLYRVRAAFAAALATLEQAAATIVVPITGGSSVPSCSSSGSIAAGDSLLGRVLHLWDAVQRGRAPDLAHFHYPQPHMQT